MLGSRRLESLSVADVRRFLVQLEKKTSAATAKESHRVLRTALTAAFVLAIALGFRRGEVVGLRWENVDLDKREIRVRTQRQRVGGEVYEADPKGRRRKPTLPLPAICVAPLRWQRLKQAAARERAGEKWTETGYVFTTRPGQPIEPRNLYRSFTRVAKNADLRVVRLHDARHGTATLLTAAGVPPRHIDRLLRSRPRAWAIQVRFARSAARLPSGGRHHGLRPGKLTESPRGQ